MILIRINPLLRLLPGYIPASELESYRGVNPSELLLQVRVSILI
jgi:hypothetical protein